MVPTREDKVTVTLGGKDDIINADDFVTIVRGTIAVLKSLNAEARWTIGDISRSSPAKLEIQGEKKTLERFVEGMSILNSDDVHRPEAFDDTVLKHAKKIVRPLNNGVSKITYRLSRRKEIAVSQRVAASVDALRHSEKYTAYTELEGELGLIHVHGGRSEFCIYDALTDKSTTCRFKVDEPERIGAHITHRVRVYGKATYSRATHAPERIDVERWKPIGDNAVSLEELHRAGFRITTGERSEELIRKNRNLDDRKDSLG